MTARSIDAADFYRLGFASQMIVWAARKRMHLLASGESETNVIEVFGLAGLEGLHASLMGIVDVLLCGRASRIRLHRVACPSLSPHEISLLNALAYLQLERRTDAERCLRELFCAAAARLVQPALDAIVKALDDRNLRLT